VILVAKPHRVARKLHCNGQWNTGVIEGQAILKDIKKPVVVGVWAAN